jgi:hypothetical protein
MDAIIPSTGQFFADDPPLLTTVMRALDRVLMMATKNGWGKR